MKAGVSTFYGPNAPPPPLAPLPRGAPTAFFQRDQVPFTTKATALASAIGIAPAAIVSQNTQPARKKPGRKPTVKSVATNNQATKKISHPINDVLPSQTTATTKAHQKETSLTLSLKSAPSSSSSEDIEEENGGSDTEFTPKTKAGGKTVGETKAAAKPKHVTTMASAVVDNTLSIPPVPLTPIPAVKLHSQELDAKHTSSPASGGSASKPHRPGKVGAKTMEKGQQTLGGFLKRAGTGGEGEKEK